MPRRAASWPADPNHPAGLRLQLVAAAGATAVALVIATALSVFKPRGLTPFDQGGDSRGSGLQQWGWTQIAMILVGVGLGILVVAHLITGSARH